MISGSVSSMACLSAIFIIILFKKWQTFGQRLILYLMISTTLLSLVTVLRLAFSNNVVNTAYRGFCAFTGFASQVEIWMIINTTTAITIYIFLGLVCNKLTENTRSCTSSLYLSCHWFSTGFLSSTTLTDSQDHGVGYGT